MLSPFQCCIFYVRTYNVADALHPRTALCDKGRFQRDPCQYILRRCQSCTKTFYLLPLLIRFSVVLLRTSFQVKQFFAEQHHLCE